jgi:hypothetical protein
MPTQSEQVISSFLTRFAYEKLAVSTTWSVPPGFKVLILGPELASCLQTCMTYTIAEYSELTPDDGQTNCPKHVELNAKINLRNQCIWLVLL